MSGGGIELSMEKTREIAIEGMHCDGCVRRVKSALEKLPGVAVESVRVGGATILGDVEDAVIAEAIARLGFQVKP
jgi:copper chaperone CopZ